MVTTKDGWVKPHALVVWRLVILANIVQLGQRHQVVNLIKEKARQILKKPGIRWTRHGRRKMVTIHQMEKRSLHLMGQVITPHQTKQLRGMWDWYSNASSYISSNRSKYWKDYISMNEDARCCGKFKLNILSFHVLVEHEKFTSDAEWMLVCANLLAKASWSWVCSWCRVKWEFLLKPSEGNSSGCRVKWNLHWCRMK